MLYLVDKVHRKAGKFTDPKTNKEIEYDNFYFHLDAYDEEGNFVDAICPKIKAKYVRDTIEKGDLVEVFKNEYKVPFMVQLVQKGEMNK